ncbi:MAG: DUF6929 family protein [Cytophagaceae bacterium]
MQCTNANFGDSFIHIEKSLTIDTIPSGSGMAFLNDTIYIVGDDSPFLFLLSRDYEPYKKHLLIKGFSLTERIPKAVKPDFEAIAEWQHDNDTFLLIFGSGSKPEKRDALVMVNIKNPENPEIFSLTKFYKYLMETSGIKRKHLNIEGAEVLNNKLYLFNRATNQLIIIDIENFMNYVRKRTKTPPPLTTHKIELPVMNGVHAGFSGATRIPGTTKIIFSATLEDTRDWISDGKILGSYIGIIDTRNPENVKNISLITRNGKSFQDKVESLAFEKFGQNGEVYILSVADNDDGTSKLMELRLDRRFFE